MSNLLARFGRQIIWGCSAPFPAFQASDVLTYKKTLYRCSYLGDRNMGQGRTIHESDWKDGFLFVGNDLVLDFLNTSPVQNGETKELLPDFRALLRWFQAAALLNSREVGNLRKQWGESVRARHTVEAMRELRERLRDEVLSWERGGTVHHAAIDDLNRLMAEHPMLIRLNTSGSASSTELWFDPRRPEDLFAPLAHSAATLFANTDRNRVRKCDQC